MKDLQKIYADKVNEALFRLNKCEVLINSYFEIRDVLDLESSILHMRKALEILALASIAPNKIKYQEYRAQANKNPDYTKDYKASSILKALSEINSDFYPIPLLPAKKLPDGSWHFDRKRENFFHMNQFIKLYDRLGKYLHADNPWANNKEWENFASVVQKSISSIRELLKLYFTVIRTPEFTGVWVLETRDNIVQFLIVESKGEFLVEDY